MKNSEELTTVELMEMIKMSLRVMHSMDITDKNLPTAINLAKATAMGATTALKIAAFDAKSKASKNGNKVKTKLEEKTNQGSARLIR